MAELEKLALEAAAKGGEIVAFPLDTTKPEEASGAVQRVENEMGPISIAVLCAGTYEPVLARELTGGESAARVRTSPSWARCIASKR